jgi:aryl sulfotransferase
VTEPSIARTRVYRHHHLDSTRWDHITFRNDDIVITTPYKCGTTWTQHIVAGLLHGPGTMVDRGLSPWIDARFWGPIEPIAAAIEATPTRRFFKSHLALDGMAWDERVKYVVIGRDSRDVFMSLLNHYANYGDVAMRSLNDDPSLPPLELYDGDLHALWANWISRGSFAWEEDGWPFWSHHHHLATWWTVRDAPNVLLLHYNDLSADPTAQIRRLADFLEIDRSDEVVAAVAAATQINAMRDSALRAEAARGGPGSDLFKGGVASFIYKGTNGRWRGVLTEGELARYESRAARLDPEFRVWLENGSSRAWAGAPSPERWH